MHILSLSGQGAHSLLVLFPLVLLLLVPALLVIASLAAGQQRRRLLVSSLIGMALGTGLLYAAGAAGEMASGEHRLAEQLQAAVSEHRTFANAATLAFAVATGLLALLLLLTLGFHLRPLELDAVLTIGFLAFYASGFLMLLRTFYRGGDLVHSLGI